MENLREQAMKIEVTARLQSYYVIQATDILLQFQDKTEIPFVDELRQKVLLMKSKIAQYAAEFKDRLRLSQMDEARRSLHKMHNIALRLKALYESDVTGRILKEANI